MAVHSPSTCLPKGATWDSYSGLVNQVLTTSASRRPPTAIARAWVVPVELSASMAGVVDGDFAIEASKHGEVAKPIDPSFVPTTEEEMAQCLPDLAAAR